MKRAIALAVLLSLAPLASAAEQQDKNKPDQHWYAVEVIVFSPATNMAGGNELWPPDPTLPDLKKAVVPALPDATSTTAPKTTFALPSAPATTETATVAGDTILPLPTTRYQLDGVWNQLQNSGRYAALLHTGWIERGVPRRQAKPVSITPLMPASIAQPQAVTTFSDTTMTPQPATSQAAENPGTAEDTEKTTPPAAAPAFGTVKLAYDRYLYLALNIAWRPPHPAAIQTWRAPQTELATPATAIAPIETGFSGMGPFPTLQPSGPRAIVMNESRRVEANKLNYFDNPLFGVIVQVRPVSPPAAVAPADF
ncbi:MAG TPA: CsiV family protein [Gammaproteobacteria bacterium]|nr:CsiV family protein [Gammaproteobacteria bacterium]